VVSDLWVLNEPTGHAFYLLRRLFFQKTPQQQPIYRPLLAQVKLGLVFLAWSWLGLCVNAI